MVQPFVFLKQSEKCGASSTCAERSNGGTSTLRSRNDRRSRPSTRKLQTRKASGQDGYPELKNVKTNSGTGSYTSRPDSESEATDDSETANSARKSCSEKSALQEIASVGQEIFWFILSEELSSRENAEPGCLSDLSIQPSKQRERILDQTITGGSLTLREMTKEFSKTAYRRSVRQLADYVDLDHLSYSTFSDLLAGIFQEGKVTRERVLVLYFFCSDLALRAAYLHLSNQFRRLVQWISFFIATNLSVWVHENGGWAAVLQESPDYLLKLAVTGVCLIGIVTCVLFVTKHFIK